MSQRAPAGVPRSGLLATPALSWAGRLPEKKAVLVFAGIAALGTILTVVMGQDPGFLLGLFLILGSVAATAAVRRGAAHKFIPLPALAYLVAATITGMAHDSESLNSTRQFLLDFLTWIGGSFVAVTASTILVVLIALSRWLLSRRLVSGQLPAGGGAGSPRTTARPASRGPRGDRDSSNGRDPRDDRTPRSSRDQRDDGGSPGNSGPWGNQGRLDDRGPRTEGTWPGQTLRGNREQRDDDTWGSQGSWDDRGRRDEGTWPSQGMRGDRDTRGDRPPGGDPRDKRHDRGPYADRDPHDAPRSPNGPRDIW